MTIENYKKTVAEQITKNKKYAVGFKNTHNILSIIGIVLTIAIAAVLGIGASTGINLGILIASVSCAGAACAVLVTDRIFDFEAKAIACECRMNALEKELHLFEMHAGIYSHFDEKCFVERCEEIMK